MRLKADWFSYLHDLRVREFRLIFDRFALGSFEHALELGAGDGFQSAMLLPYARSLVSTDFSLPPPGGDPRIEVRAMPAERVAEVYGAGKFDLVYSSNMLEHVPDPSVVLKAVAEVLTDDGITIHVMPNRTWKICQLSLHVPHLVATVADELVTARSGRALLDRMRKFTGADGPVAAPVEKNNPSVVRPPRSLIQKALVPEPHGVCLTHREEFAAFSRRRWEAELTRAGFQILAVLNGPFSSGYGFGFTSLARRLEEHGVGSEYVYVAKKAGKLSRYEGAFSIG